MLNRREFIKNSSVAVAATMVLPSCVFPSKPEKIIGIQLYTLRDQVNEDFLGTLNKIAKIGFRAVEAAGYSDGKFYNYSPAEYKKIIEDMGMIPQSSHSMFTLDKADQVIEDTKQAGMTYLVIPYLDKSNRTSIDDYKRVAEEFNKIGEKCNKVGLRFGYHNHAFEFEKLDEIIPYNILLEQTDPELVTMQLDTYWMIYGGYGPVDYFKNYPGRFELWHIKDLLEGEERKSTEIGNGTIDFQKIFSHKKTAGLKHIYLEQEAFDIPPFESIELSFNYLSKMDF